VREKEKCNYYLRNINSKEKIMKKDTSILKQVVAENIRMMRLNNGDTQEEIGNVLGVTFQQIQKYETASISGRFL
jgi:DNA-binding XRE family transcriptional regulator